MSREPEQVTVTIYGENYSIAGEDPERLRRIAGMVDKQMKRISQAVGQISLGRLAVLTALNMASDLLDAQDRDEELGERWEEGAQRLLRLVEDSLPDR